MNPSHRHRLAALLAAPSLLLLLPSVRADYVDIPAQEVSLEQEVASLKAQVATALAGEQQLAATNAELRHQVDGWVDVGNKVLSREAHIVEAIKQTGDGAKEQSALRAAVLAGLAVPEPAKPNTPLALSSTAVKTETHSSAGQTAGHMPSQIISWHLIVLVITGMAVAAFCVLRAPAPLARILSGEKLIQLSELQLEGASMGFGEGYLLIEPSGAMRTRTRLAEQKSGSSLLRFDEVVTIPVKKRDGPCIFTVFRRGDHRDVRIGMVSVQSSELLSCVGRGPEAPGQYFRFNVEADPGARETQLRVAMRIRDFAGLPGVQKKAGFCPRTKSTEHVV